MFFGRLKQNLPCGTIIITEANGIQYLLDGLQRTTSLMLLTNDEKNYTPEECEREPLILVVVVACPPLAFLVVIGKLIVESIQENKYK